MTKYILVGWPDIQDFMMHPRKKDYINGLINN